MNSRSLVPPLSIMNVYIYLFVANLTLGLGLGASHCLAQEDSPLEGVTRTSYEPLQSVYELEGILEIGMFDDFINKNSRTDYFIRTDDEKRYPIQTFDPNMKFPASFSKIRIRRASILRAVSQSEILILEHASDLITLDSIIPTISNALGDQRSIFMLANYHDKPTEKPWAINFIRSEAKKTSDFFYEGSFHQTSMSADVFGYFTISKNSDADCPGDPVADEIDNQARSQGINPSAYSHRIYIFPNAKCAGIGYAWVGTAIGGSSRTWIVGYPDPFFFGHEIGHNLGLGHANSYHCGDASPIPENDDFGTCEHKEYGDPSDVMGQSPHPAAYYSAYFKERLKWLDSSASPPIATIGKSGTYTLEPFETKTANPKAFRILKRLRADGSKDYYYFDFRQPIGGDAPLGGIGNLTKGILIHIANDRDLGFHHLLDMNPATHEHSDAALGVGRTFTDPTVGAGGLRITVNEISSIGAVVSVALGDAAATCVRANPALSISPGNAQYIQSGGSAYYTVTLQNNDSSICTAATYSLYTSAGTTSKNGLTSGISAPTLKLGPGVSGSVNLSVTALGGLANGTYPVSLTASHSTVTNVAAINTSKLSIQNNACVVTRPALTFSPNTQTAIRGLSTVYKVDIKNNNSASCAPVYYILSNVVPQGLSGVLSQSVISIKSGASGTVNLEIGTEGNLVSGTYPIAFAASDTSDASLTISSIANLVIQPQCMHLDPSLLFSPLSWTGAPGVTSYYNVFLTNNDTQGCGPSTFNLSAVAPDSLIAAKFRSTQLVLGPGVRGAASLSVRSDSLIPVGMYPITVSAVNPSVADILTSAQTIYAIQTYVFCSHLAPTVTFSLGVTVAMGEAAGYTVSIKNNDSIGCGVSSFKLAADAPNVLRAVLGQSTITLAPAQIAGVLLGVGSTKSTPPGTYTLGLKATHSVATDINGYGTVKQTVK